LPQCLNDERDDQSDFEGNGSKITVANTEDELRNTHR